MDRHGPKKYHPPTSVRWCMECREYRTFKYNPAAGHSECTICGSRKARRSAPRKGSGRNFQGSHGFS